MENLRNKIKEFAETYASNLKEKIDMRKEAMKSDDNAHYLIYRVLGITTKEGELIDIYQNTGRFLYKYAGSFLEEAATLCLNYKFPDGIKTKVKKHTRVKAIKGHGYKPIRVMFYYPQREQAIRIQETLKTLYAGVEGKYFGGDEAWDFLKTYSGVDLKAILTDIANERTPEDGKQ